MNIESIYNKIKKISYEYDIGRCEWCRNKKTKIRKSTVLFFDRESGEYFENINLCDECYEKYRQNEISL